ncbi:MAG: type II toxin-antitoxin system RelE/ParE family toxin [Planctomycetes bacterium]|nr:type II toxin-antitoxin system RelE/ParE family toxin [Planctomycetota bacterium]
MEIEFFDDVLDRLETEEEVTGGYPREIVRAYRRRLQAIRAADDERDLYVFASWRFKKLHGERSHQRSIRLNDQWRLVVEIKPATPKNIMVIVSIEDYH